MNAKQTHTPEDRPFGSELSTKPPLTIGFNMLAESGDWAQFLAMCRARQLGCEDGYYTVSIPVGYIGLFLQQLGRNLYVSNIHGVQDGVAVRLPEYLQKNMAP